MAFKLKKNAIQTLKCKQNIILYWHYKVIRSFLTKLVMFIEIYFIKFLINYIKLLLIKYLNKYSKFTDFWFDILLSTFFSCFSFHFWSLSLVENLSCFVNTFLSLIPKIYSFYLISIIKLKVFVLVKIQKV